MASTANGLATLRSEGSDAWLGSSEMSRRVRAFDWSKTPLGPIGRWPQSLKLAVATCLRSPFQMAVFWGRDLNCIYNDAERAILGNLHPRVLGLPARELPRASWGVLEPALRAVVERGESRRAEDHPLTLNRRGKPEVSYFTYSFSPILSDDGAVGGALLVTHDATARVLAERRVNALRELTARSLDARTIQQACTQSCTALSTSADVPFALVYLIDDDAAHAICMAARAGTQPLRARRRAVELEPPSEEIGRLFGDLAAVRSPGGLLPAQLFVAPGSYRQDLPERVCVLPIARGVTDPVEGFLIAGVRDDLVFDQPYADFVELTALEIGRSLAAASARETEHRRVSGIAAAQGRIEARARYEGEMRAMLNDLRAAQRRVAAAGDAERRRIERDLHDGAQQRLMAVRLELGLLEEHLKHDPDRALKLLPDVRRELDEALQELRELAHGLYPPLLATDGLEAALTATARRSPIPVTIQATGMTRAPRSVESTAYFCCLEALQNAAKHAGPGACATIELGMENGALTFGVTDDGAGFDPEVVRPGHGLINLRDRLDALGGTADITSSPGAGTTVSGEIPLP